MPKGTEVHVGFFWPQSKQTYPTIQVSMAGAVCAGRISARGLPRLALLAGFVFNFSKIFSDCCFVARPLMLTQTVRNRRLACA